MKAEEAPGDVTALLVLAVLVDGPAHGYEIGRRVADRSDGVLALREGSLYPLLHAMESDGLVASAWNEGHGRRRRVYRLTEDGRGALRREEQSWARKSAAVQRVLREVTEIRTI